MTDSSGSNGAGALHDLLVAHRDRIVREFVAQVQEQGLPPSGTARSLLADHIPRFLDELVAELGQRSSIRNSQDAFDTNRTAREHGGQRWSLGYDLDALIREYGILRHCILTCVRECRSPIHVDEFDVLAKYLNVGIAQAASAYVHYRDQEMRAQKADVQLLAEASEVLGASLDIHATLSRFARLLVPCIADWCVILGVDDRGAARMPVAHVQPAKVDLLRQLLRLDLDLDRSLLGTWPESSASRAAMHTLSEGRLEASGLDPSLRALARLTLRSWTVAPLVAHGQRVGTLVLGWDEPRARYDSDTVLAEDLGRRAALAMDNARLFELSQRERARVEEATRAKDEFVAVISHELRTPLNVILGWSRLLRGETLNEEQRRHAVDVIQRNATAQNRLVGDLLDLSRIVSGKIRLNLAQVDLRELVAMVVEGVRPAAEAKRITLRADFPGEVPLVRADADRLEQVVWNLLTNAVKFTPRHGHIFVRVREGDSNVVIEVEDDGIGIASEFLPWVFERFRQETSGTSRLHGGLGLGLSIAKHMVELHGGSIEARSRGVGLGASFLVSLPVSALAPIPLVRPAVAIPLLSGRGPDLAGVKVLVVDDDPDARDLLDTLLQMHGAVVQSAATAEEAFERLTTFEADVVLSDIGMPGTDGYGLIRHIRALPLPGQRDLAAIALTSFARGDDRTRALLAGFNAHLPKPVEPAVLVATVADLVGRPTGA
jgi:signal transduction histidine kinase